MSSKGDNEQLIEKVRRNTMLSVTTTTVTAPSPPINKPAQQNTISAAGDRNLEVSPSQSKHVQERNKNLPPYTNYIIKGNQPNIRNTAAETSTNAGFKKLALPVSADSGVLPKGNISLRAVSSSKTEKMNQPQKKPIEKTFTGFRTPNDDFTSDSLDLPEPMKKIASSFGKNIQSKELTVTVQKPSLPTSSAPKETNIVTVLPSHVQVTKMTAGADFFKSVANSVTAQPVNEVKKTASRILGATSMPGASKSTSTPMNIEVSKTVPAKPSSVAEVTTTVPAAKKQAPGTSPFSDTARSTSETSLKTPAKTTVTSSRTPTFVLANSSPTIPALSLIPSETVPTNLKDNSFSSTVLLSLKEQSVLDTINAGNGWSFSPSVTISKPITITPSSTPNPKGRADATVEAAQKTNSSGSSSASGNLCKRDDVTDKSGSSPLSGSELPRGTNVLSSPAEVDTFEASSYLISAEEMEIGEIETSEMSPPDEPECLTISSDEESEEDEQFIGLPDKPEISFSVSNKEPQFIEKNEKSSVAADGSMCEPDEEGALDNTSGDGYVSLSCRTVRIGSLKLSPPVPVVLSKFGLRIVIPNSENVVLKIPFREITRVLIHFGRSFPVIFYYVTSSMGVKARSILKMAYYDPNTSSEAQRRITLFPENMTDTNRLHVCEIFKDTNLMRELSQEEANQILVSSAPKEVQRVVKQVPDPVQTIMVFPPPPAKGGISINTEDYSCLARDVFLNDVIIDFYLKYLYLNHITPEDREKTHIFSSFFYKRLTDKATPMPRHLKSAENVVSAAEIRHSRVTKWTKNIDIFSKDYIVIPLNENQHWFLAIICFPGLRGPVKFSDNKPIESEPKTEVENASTDPTITADSEKPSSSASELTITTVKVESKDRVKISLDDDNDAEDRDEAEATDEDPNVSEEDTDEEYLRGVIEDAPKPRTRSTTREPIKQPCILIFDSLAGASRARIIATLRDYLRIEYKIKHGEDRDFSKNVVKGSVPAVPQQDNFTDCGLFVLQYVESFFDTKITDYHIPIKTLRNWFQPENVCNKRYEIQQLLHSLMRVQEIDIESLKLPNLHLGGSDDEDDDDDDEYYEEPSGSDDEDYQEHYETVVYHPSRLGYPAEDGEMYEEDEDEELMTGSRYEMYDTDEDEMVDHMDSDEDSSDVVYKNMDGMKERQFHQMHEAGDHRCRSEDGEEEDEVEEEEIEADLDDDEEQQQFSSDIEEKINNSNLNREAVSITVNNRSFSPASSSSQTAIVTSTTPNAKPKQRGADKFKACSPWKTVNQSNNECSAIKKFRQN